RRTGSLVQEDVVLERDRNATIRTLQDRTVKGRKAHRASCDLCTKGDHPVRRSLVPKDAVRHAQAALIDQGDRGVDAIELALGDRDVRATGSTAAVRIDQRGADHGAVKLD